MILPFPTLLLALYLCGSGIAVAKDRDSETLQSLVAGVDAYVAARVNEEKLPGYALAVIKDGKIILKKGYGFANVERAQRVTNKTIFGLASLTKAMTAICLLSLVEQGKIGLDDPLGKYIPDLPQRYGTLTLSQLATMTAGVPGDLEPEVAWDEQLAALARKPLDFAPGSKSKYSNASYRLLGSVIERVTGKTFMDVVHETILEPNGMSDTGTVVSLAPTGLVAQAYDEKGEVSYKRPETSFASGMLASNLDDMTRYAQALLARKMLSEASYHIMWYRPVALADGRMSNWHFGWQSKSASLFGGTRIVEWTGKNVGVAATLIILPAKDGAVIALCNMQKEAAFKIPHEVAEKVFGGRV